MEHARVRLPAQPGEEGSDYINASFLQVKLKSFVRKSVFRLTNVTILKERFTINYGKVNHAILNIFRATISEMNISSPNIH